MYRIFLFSFFLASFSLFSLDKERKTTVTPEPKTAWIEATVVNSTCGYMLRLSDGQLIRPANLPKKFKKQDEKVVLIFDEIKDVNNSPCLVKKDVHIAEIHSYRLSPGLQAKY